MWEDVEFIWLGVEIFVLFLEFFNCLVNGLGILGRRIFFSRNGEYFCI